MIRITPMCMGSTPTRYAYGRLLRNHPHVYGEYATPVEFPKSLSESPPCVWGVRSTVIVVRPVSRITPMCMGSTMDGFDDFWNV